MNRGKEKLIKWLFTVTAFASLAFLFCWGFLAFWKSRPLA